MNRYKTVFNRSLGVWQAVSELARAHGKSGGAVLCSAALVALTTLSAPALADTTIGGSFQAGNQDVAGTQANPWYVLDHATDGTTTLTGLVIGDSNGPWHGGTLVIKGSRVYSVGAYIMGNSTVTVDAGGVWVNQTNAFDAPYEINLGAGSTLSILNGSSVTSSRGSVGPGEGANSDGIAPTGQAIAIVDGAGSSWTMEKSSNPIGWANNGSLTVGQAGGTGILKITHGAHVSNTIGTVGETSTANALGLGVVTVDGAGSTWTNSEQLIIGASSVGGDIGDGTVNITNGGSVSSPVASIGRSDGVSSAGSGTLNVDGAHSTYTGVAVVVGVGGDGVGAVNVTGGGGVILAPTAANPASSLFIGAMDGNTKGVGTVTVDGAGSTITSPGVSIGLSGGDGTLIVRNSGKVKSTMVNVGGFQGSKGDIKLNAGTIDGGVIVMDKGTLSGAGTITGNVSVMSGGTLNSVAGGVLHVGGNLGLAQGASMDVTVGPPSSTGLFQVDGNITLGGATLKVSDGGNFGNGLYRLFDYNGTLTDTAGLTVGSTPAGYAASDLTVQTSVAKQVNLVVAGGTPPASGLHNFWSGSGTWSATNTNWTNANGTINGAYDPSALLIFQTPGGTVTVDGGGNPLPIGEGLQFAANGYTIKGDGLKLTAASTELRVGDGSAAGAGYTATIASALTGASSVEKTEIGTLILSGANTYTGSTTVNGGELAVTGSIASSSLTTVNSGATLSGNGTVGNTTVNGGGTLKGVAGATLTTGNLILNSGSIITAALGAPSTTELFKVNGNLTLGGVLNVSNAGNFGDGLYRLISYTGTLTDNVLAIGTAPTGYSASDLTVQTSVAKQVNLVVAGGTPPASGLHNFWNGAGTWNANGTNWTDANGTANGAYDPAAMLIFQPPGGTVTVDGGGNPLAIGSGLQFASGGYTITGDGLALTATTTSLRVGDGTNAGAGYTATIASALTGNGSIEKNDIGTLVLTGTNIYTGSTTVKAGTLAGNIAANTDLTVDTGATYDGTGAARSVKALNGGGKVIDANGLTVQSGAFSGEISGAGGLTKTGNGQLTLSGVNTYTGLTNVNGGILSIAATGHIGAVTINNGGFLKGVGTVGDLIVKSGATLAPGNSIGQLNVAGNITFEVGSTYEVEVDAAGNHDFTHATGTATLNGGTVQALAGAGNYAPATTYTILTADGGRSGNFAGVTSNLAFLDPSLSYNANSVYLTMTRNDVTFTAVSGTKNQRAAGAGVESLGGAGEVSAAILNLTADQARAAFDQLSGEIHASAKSALLEDSRFVRDASNDRLRDAQDGMVSGNMQVAYADDDLSGLVNPAERGVVWARAFTSRGDWDGDGNAARLKRTVTGLFIGADAPVARDVRIGVLAGYSYGDLDANQRNSSDKSDNYHLGAYAGAKWDALALRTGVSYTWHSIDSRRNVAIPGYSDRLKGNIDARTAQAYAELGYGIDADEVALEPYVNLAYVNLKTDGFSEKGGAAALKVKSDTTGMTFGTMGLRFGMAVDSAKLRGGLGWRHAFGNDRPDATLAFAGGSAFTVAGTPIAKNAAVVDAGLDFTLQPNATLGVSYTGQFGNGAKDNGIRATLAVKF